MLRNPRPLYKPTEVDRLDRNWFVHKPGCNPCRQCEIVRKPFGSLEETARDVLPESGSGHGFESQPLVHVEHLISIPGEACEDAP